jgi:hypothetical protein
MMRDASIESCRDAYLKADFAPSETLEHVQFCLERLFDAPVYFDEDILRGMTAEELSGALLGAERYLKQILTDPDDA